MSIQVSARALRARETSSVKLVTAALDRIRLLNPGLNAFQTMTEESALAAARAADAELARGVDRGPLHGIPIALKDLFYTRGVRTTAGSKLFADFVPDHDAAVVERLTVAGAISVGKTGMHELAYGITSDNPHFGTVRNPWDLRRIPGGSSGGSGAAVAADIVPMAMGSDTGGSIRIPASFCGCVGLKPTYGRVSRYGAFPLGFTLDHMGPLARTVRDCAITLEAIAGYDARDDSTSRRPVDKYVPAPGCSIRGLHVGVAWLQKLEPGVRMAVEQAVKLAESLGAVVSEVQTPDVAELNAVARVILMSEASAALESHVGGPRPIGEDVLALLRQGMLIPATDYVNAQRLRRLMRRDWGAAFDRVDCLFTPATPNTAPEIGQPTVILDGEPENTRIASTRLARGINVLGWPALALPCGRDVRGLPVGLQILGRPFAEALILRAGAALEDAGLTAGKPPL